MLSEVHHRVKNNLQMIQSFARLKQKDNKVDIYEIEDTINAFASAHEAIYKSERFDEINLEDYLKICDELNYFRNYSNSLHSQTSKWRNKTFERQGCKNEFNYCS